MSNDRRDVSAALAIAAIVGMLIGFGFGAWYGLSRNDHKADEAAHTQGSAATEIPVVPGVKKVSEPRSKSCLVDKVIDAITVRANCDGSGMIVVRQIGVRAPTGKQCYAGKALDAAKAEMYHNSAIKIYQDQTYAPKTAEGYTNAYIVTRPDDYIGVGHSRWYDFDWGNTLIRLGRADAVAATVTPYMLQGTYLQEQTEAKDASYGKWGACTW